MASGTPVTKVRHWPWLIRCRSKAKLCSRTPRRASTTTVRSHSPSPACSAVSVSVGTTRTGPVPNRGQSAAVSGHRDPSSTPARRRSAVVSARQSCKACSARELPGSQHLNTTVNSLVRVCRQNCPQSTRRPAWRRSAYVAVTRAIGSASIYLQLPPSAHN